MNLSNVKDQGNGIRSGTLPNGNTVNVRPYSNGKVVNGQRVNDGKPTLHITTGNKRYIKIRYNE